MICDCRYSRKSDSALLDILDKLGFLSTRIAQKELYESDFRRISSSERISIEHFAVDFESRGCSTALIHASFKALDVDRRGYVTRYEYILCRAAFDYDIDRDNGTELLKFRLQIVFNMYDTNNDGIVDMTEFERLISELARGKSHVGHIMADMGVPTGASVSFNQFLLGASRGALAKYFLHTRDIINSHSVDFKRENRVTLDPRAVTAHCGLPGLGIETLPAGPPPLLPASSASITGAALTRDFVVDVSMISESDWRGPLVPPRDSNEFTISKRVIDNGMRLMREHLNRSSSGKRVVTEDQPDSNWLINGAALNFLMGTPDKATQIRMISSLATCCCTIFSKQPMMVQVPCPCKIFGDIHGQLRDLLLLFREFGFPSNNSGDVESISYVFDGDFVDRGHHQLEVCLR